MKITLTGVDERTDLYALRDLVEQYGDSVEFGILLSAKPEGRNRYPRSSFIGHAASHLKHRLAVHICGKTARELFLENYYDDFMSNVGRVQINGYVTMAELDKAFKVFPRQIITQLRVLEDEEDDLRWSGWLGGNHALLVDASGGRGISPDVWMEPETDGQPVGYAGGLGPDNLAYELQRIPVSTSGWVDMETKLRTDDWFDISKAATCAEIASHC